MIFCSMKEYVIKSGLVARERKLVLTEDYLEWENKDLKGNEFTRLNKSDYLDFRHGMDWIVWYKFTVGRKFLIAFKDKRNRELKIQFDSYFGLRTENNQTYSDIINDVWSLYHSKVVDRFLDGFYNDGQTEVQGLELRKDGIELRGANALIPWDKVLTKDYYRYFAIYHRDNPTLHARVSYNEYGTETAWSVIRTILKEKEENY